MTSRTILNDQCMLAECRSPALAVGSTRLSREKGTPSPALQAPHRSSFVRDTVCSPRSCVKFQFKASGPLALAHKTVEAWKRCCLRFRFSSAHVKKKTLTIMVNES